MPIALTISYNCPCTLADFFRSLYSPSGTGSITNVAQQIGIIQIADKIEEVSRRDLVHWATACGLPDADHTDKLLGKTFLALVGIEPANNGYKESNGIKQFRFDTEISPKKAKADKPSPKTVEDDNSFSKASDNPWD